MQAAAADRKWMIKSENRILGPYSYDQIEDLLKKKQITLIDEVRDMDTRWMYVRESEALKAIVEEIREELANTDDHTKTYQTRTSQGLTKTGTITQELVQAENTKFEMPNFTNVKVEDAEFTEEETPAPKPLKPQAPAAAPAAATTVAKTKAPQQYVSAADPAVNSQIRERSKLTLMILISILLAVIVVAGGSHFYQQRDK